MSKTFEDIITAPSIVREQWLSPELAVREVLAFERRFGSKHLMLACHAALPLILTPELLNLIHINFLEEEQISWVAEVDFLLSPLCRPIDESLFEVEPSIREVLLVDMENQFGFERPLRLAEFLQFYLEHKSGLKQRSEITRTQQWIAQAYIEPDRVIEELLDLQESDLSQPDYLVSVSEQIQIINILEILAEPLERANQQTKYKYLINNSRVVAQSIYGYVDKTIGAIAYAAAARQQPDALNHLLPFVLSRGDAYQKRLHQALSSAPKHLILDSWDTLLHLLAAANHTAAINTAKTLSLSIARWWEVLEERLPEAINAVAARASTLHNGKDDRSLVMGWLLQHCLPLVAKEPSQSILAALRQHYFLAGHRMSVQILQIHQHLTVPRTDRAELLNILQQREIPNDTSLESAIIAFAVDFLKPLKTSDWLAFLDQTFPKRWNKTQATAVGQLAAACPDTLQILFERVLAAPQQTGEQLSRTFAALEAAVIAGATGSVTAFFTGLDLSSLLSPTCKSLLNFLYRIVPLLSPQQQDEITRQVQISIPDELQETVLPLLDRLADKSAVARQLLESSLECLAPALQTQYRLRLLRFEPIAQHPPLDTLDKDTQMLLIQHYRVLDLPEAVERLLQASLLKREHVALAASKDWDERQLKYLNIPRVIPLLAATYPGIQERTLGWIIRLWKDGEPLDIKTLSQICQTITYAANPAIACSLCELVATWVQQHRQMPVGVVQVLGHSLETMIQQKQFDGAPAKPMIKALKAIAQSEEPTLDTEKLYYWVCQLLTTINLIKIPHSEPEVIDLLSAITRLKACYLCRLTDELLPVFAEKEWRRNLSAILRTVRRIEGVKSSLFQKITEAPWYNEFVESILLEVRGL